MDIQLEALLDLIVDELKGYTSEQVREFALVLFTHLQEPLQTGRYVIGIYSHDAQPGKTIRKHRRQAKVCNYCSRTRHISIEAKKCPGAIERALGRYEDCGDYDPSLVEKAKKALDEAIVKNKANGAPRKDYGRRYYF